MKDIKLESIFSQDYENIMHFCEKKSFLCEILQKKNYSVKLNHQNSLLFGCKTLQNIILPYF
jgi:hypothetical protein